MQREQLLLREMIDAAKRICVVIGELDTDELRADDLRLESVLWNFTVLGEAATQVPEELKQRHSHIGWAQPTRLRNRIVHGYWSVDVSILHAAAVNDLPQLIDQLSAVLATYESAERQGAT